MQDLIPLASQIISDWKELGALAGFVAIVNLLVYLTKLASGEGAPEWLAKLFGFISAPWRPWLALGLGSLGGFLSGIQSGAPIMEAIAGGLAAGLAAIGVHQIVGTLHPSEAAKRDAAAVVNDALSGSEEETKAKIEALKSNLDAAVAFPDKKSRLKALADFANSGK